MANLNYQKLLNYCKKQINENPFVAKAIFIHVCIVAFVYVLSFISNFHFNSSAELEAQVNENKKIQVIQATSITSQELNKQVSAYEHHREKKRQAQADIQEARADIKKARAEALERAKQREKAKAEDKRQAKLEQEKKAQKAAKRKKQQELESQKQAKAEKERKNKLEAERKLKEKQKLAAEKKRKAREKAAQEARDKRRAKAKAEAQEAARKQVEKSRAQAAISDYISQYQERVGSNWIKDACRGIYKFPRAVTRNGKFIKLTGTTGNYRCDQSLIDAIKNTQSPAISNSVAKQTIQDENLSFKFNSN